MSNMTYEDLIKCYDDLNNNKKELKSNIISADIFSPSFLDYKIIEDINMVDIKIEVINKTWKERFFSLPWKPWIKTNVIEKRIPKHKVYIIDNYGVYGIDKVLICHPVMAEKLRNNIKKSERLWLCDYKNPIWDLKSF